MDANHTKIDLSAFHEIPPEPNRLNVPAISANSSGHISLNSKMRSKLEWKKVVFFTNLKADCILIKQYTDEEGYHVVPPKSAISASKVTQELVRRGVRLSARYVMHWDDEIQMWVGALDKSFKGNSAKKPKIKGTPNLKDLI